MNEPQNEPQMASPVPDEQSDLVASLSRQIMFLLLALIVLSGTVTAYLFYQARVFGQQLDVLEPQARLVVENYNRSWPPIEKAIQELIVYGQKHPDFQPILKKYGIPLTVPTATNSESKPTVSQPK